MNGQSYLNPKFKKVKYLIYNHFYFDPDTLKIVQLIEEHNTQSSHTVSIS